MGFATLLGAGAGNSSGSIAPVPMGELINFDFTTALNLDDFTVASPDGTITLTGGYLRSVNTGAINFNNYVTFNPYGSTVLNKWRVEIVFIVRSAVAPTTYGISCGINQTQLFNPGAAYAGFARFDTANAGTTYVLNRAGFVGLATDGPFTWAVGDRIMLAFERDEELLTVIETNLDDPGSITASYATITSYPSTTLPPIMGKPTIWFHGGTQDVEYLKYSSTSWKNASINFIGNSETVGYGVADMADRYSNVIMAGSTKKWNNIGSSGMYTQDLALITNELNLLNSEIYSINLGVNDRIGNVPSNEFRDHLQTAIGLLPVTSQKIVNTLIPNLTNDPDAYNAETTDMANDLGLNPVVDLTTVLGTGTPKLPNPALYVADMIHLNVDGQADAAGEYLDKYPSLP